MSLLDLFKKGNASPAPSPITRLDEKLPPLPPLPPPQGLAPQKAAPAPPAKPVTPMLPPLPKLDPKPVVAAPKPAPPRALGDLPKISVPEPVRPAPVPLAPVAPLAPLPTPAEAPKLENSRLAKALEELTSADFDFDTDEKPAPRPEMKEDRAPAAAPRPSGPKQRFVSMAVFDSTLRELKQVQQDLAETQANNERLGMLENQKKNSYESIVSNFEHVQKQLLAIDEKLFKVN